MTVASSSGRPLASSRDIDVLFEEFERGFQNDVKYEMERQNERLLMHTKRREEAQKAYAVVAERDLGKDKLKIAGAEDYTEVKVPFEDAPAGPSRRYRPIDTHNILIEWVKETMDRQVEAGVAVFGISVTATPALYRGIGDTISKEMALTTIVRAAYFYSLYLDALERCDILVDGKEERNAVLNVLRDLRQHVEAEGHEWFL